MKKNEKSGLRPGYLLLLPRSFRWVGVGLIGLALVIMVCRGEGILPFSKSVSVYLFEVLFILGFLFLASARRKIEDERSIYLRFQAISHAVVFTTIWYLLWPVLNLIWDVLNPATGRQVVLVLLASYFISNEMWQLLGFSHEKYTQSRKG